MRLRVLHSVPTTESKAKHVIRSIKANFFSYTLRYKFYFRNYSIQKYIWKNNGFDYYCYSYIPITASLSITPYELYIPVERMNAIFQFTKPIKMKWRKREIRSHNLFVCNIDCNWVVYGYFWCLSIGPHTYSRTSSQSVHVNGRTFSFTQTKNECNKRKFVFALFTIVLPFLRSSSLRILNFNSSHHNQIELQ